MMKKVPTNETYSWMTSTIVNPAAANRKAWGMIISLGVHIEKPT